METKEDLKNMILDAWKDGYVVFASIEGLHKQKLEEFTKQPLEGMLYDINRNTATILTLIEDLNGLMILPLQSCLNTTIISAKNKKRF